MSEPMSRSGPLGLHQGGSSRRPGSPSAPLRAQRRCEVPWLCVPVSQRVCPFPEHLLAGLLSPSGVEDLSADVRAGLTARPHRLISSIYQPVWTKPAGAAPVLTVQAFAAVKSAAAPLP